MSLPDEPFVVDYNAFFHDDDLATRRGDYEQDRRGKDLDQFRFFITTRRLIEFSLNSKVVIQTDGTYKLNWQGAPVLIVGTTDRNRSFHPFGIATCSREAHLDYKFLFDCVAKGLTMMDLPGLPKLCLMADAAPSICKGFSMSLLKESLLHRLVCWFHVKKALDQRLKNILCLVKRAEIITQIIFMQLSQTPQIFKAASRLFLKQWENDPETKRAKKAKHS